jgi:hypothetical protein
VLLRRIVVCERRLDPALRFRRIAGLNRVLRHEADADAGALSRHGGCKAGGPASDHQHVEFERRGHPATIPPTR